MCLRGGCPGEMYPAGPARPRLVPAGQEHPPYNQLWCGRCGGDYLEPDPEIVKRVHAAWQAYLERTDQA
jgi:hypothetical protein